MYEPSNYPPGVDLEAIGVSENPYKGRRWEEEPEWDEDDEEIEED